MQSYLESSLNAYKSSCLLDFFQMAPKTWSLCLHMTHIISSGLIKTHPTSENDQIPSLWILSPTLPCMCLFRSLCTQHPQAFQCFVIQVSFIRIMAFLMENPKLWATCVNPGRASSQDQFSYLSLAQWSNSFCFIMCHWIFYLQGTLQALERCS